MIANYCVNHTPKQLSDALKKLELKCKTMKGGLCLLCYWKKISSNMTIRNIIKTLSMEDQSEIKEDATELLKEALYMELEAVYSKSFDRRQNTARHAKMHPELKNMDDKRVQSAWIISLKRAENIIHALRLFVFGFGGRGDIQVEDFSDFLGDALIPTYIENVEAWWQKRHPNSKRDSRELEVKENESGMEVEEKLSEVRPQKKQKLLSDFLGPNESGKTAQIDNLLSKALKLSTSLSKLYADNKADQKETPESRAIEYHNEAKSVIEPCRNLTELVELGGHIVTIDLQQKSYVCTVCAKAFQCYHLHHGNRALRYDKPISNKITGRGQHLQNDITEKTKLVSLINRERKKNPTNYYHRLMSHIPKVIADQK